MPHEPTLDREQSSDQTCNDRLSTIDVTGAYRAESPITVSYESAFTPLADAPTIPGYIVHSELARGGMGRVLAGREERLDREVAIKILLPGAVAARFVTEAKITAKLPHPSIPPVYSLGTLADGSPYLVMKLVRGKTLADELKLRPQPLHDLPRFLHIFEQICQAIGFAHSQGIIHRDLKPANVMVGAFGEVQVMDWGLAKELSKSTAPSTLLATAPLCVNATHANETASWKAEESNQQDDLTRFGAVLGTPNFMAPEQARGEVADTRSDVFALGGILCSIMTGKAVFGGTTVQETVKQAAAGQISETLARLDACGADPDLVTLVHRSCPLTRKTDLVMPACFREN